MRNFLCNDHTVAVVDDVEYAELAIALQNVSNEVHRPGDIFLHPQRTPRPDATAISASAEDEEEEDEE